MKKFTRLLAFVMTACILLTLLAGCGGSGDDWITEESYVQVSGDGDGNASGSDGSSKSTTVVKKKKKSDSSSSTSSTANNNNYNRPKTQPKSDGITTEISGKDPNANYNVSGHITVAVNTNRPTDYEALFDSFQTVYKKVDLEIQYFADKDISTDYVLKQASIGKLPDVIFDDAGVIPTVVAQGLVKPVDDYIKNDPDIKYVSSSILNSYKYNGKTYALPNNIHFQAVMIKKDIVKELNLKMPSLSWTVDDFTAFLKAGTTDKYSGCEMLFGNNTIASQLCPIYDKNVTLYGYNASSNSFNLSSMTRGLQLMADLRKYPGLEAFALRMSGIDKYIAKFGGSNTSDTRMALKLGKTLCELDSGTWEDPNLGNFKFDKVLWPYPQSEAGRMPIHVDCSYMTTATKNPDAAFQLLRFVTYSTEGNLARLAMYDSANKDKYVLASHFYFPVTSHPDVKAKLNSLKVAEQYQYMYDNIDKCYRADPKKYVPGFGETIQTAISEWDKVTDGQADATTVNSTMQGKLNTAIKNYRKDFDEKLAKNSK